MASLASFSYLGLAVVCAVVAVITQNACRTGEAVLAARSLHVPEPRAQKNGEYENAAFFNDHAALLNKAWHQWGRQSAQLYEPEQFEQHFIHQSAIATFKTLRNDPSSVNALKEFQGMAQQAMDKWGRVDILVNNAGIVTGKKFLDCPDELMEKTVQVTLTKPVLMTF